MRTLSALGVFLTTTVAVLFMAAAATSAAAQPIVPNAMPAGSSLAPVSVVPARVPGTPCAATARACVDLSANRAWLIRDGAVEYGPVRIAHGRNGYRTSPGTFRVTFKDRHHVSSIWDASMPYSVFFNGGIAFHEGSLDRPSAGCVRLGHADAIEFYNVLQLDDRVQVR
jgi:lipoprotein-anchoring transpeptidase ErfK/SrfK